MQPDHWLTLFALSLAGIKRRGAKPLTRGNIRFIASMGSIANFSGVAQIHRRRRTAVEPLRVVPLLADQPGADNLTVSSLFEAAIDAQAIPMWHYKSVIVLFQIVLRLLTDLIALTALAFRRRRAIAAEILVLRRQIGPLHRARNQAAAN